MAELLEMREVAIEEERLYQLELDMKAAIDFSKVIKNTIYFCEEEVSSKLENEAKNSLNNIEAVFKVTDMTEDRLGNTFTTILRSEGHIYADYRESFAPKGERISLDALVAYLDQFCIKCEVTEMTYWRYGHSCKRGFDLRIYI